MLTLPFEVIPIMQDNHITICNGNRFKFSEPLSCDFEIHQIAHALSNICRFGGHVNKFYSVAQHSVLVSNLVPQEIKMEALLHDAHEAFVGDIPTPLKKMLNDYRLLEDYIEKAVRKKYKLPVTKSDGIKQADHAMFIAERNELMPYSDENNMDFQMLEIEIQEIIPLSPIQSYHYFIARYEKLYKTRIES